jgi:imidazole glycerol-phosphate synthase subunit HisF
VLRPRLIPCLLVQNKGLVKTRQFGSPKYVGDPINAVRIFNEKQVDELIVLDIDASREKRDPDYVMIRNLAAECRMPLCYGGGVTTLAQAEHIIGLGVEKVAVSTAALDNPQLVRQMADVIGSQSIVVVIDVRRRKDGTHEVFRDNGRRGTGLDPVAHAVAMEKQGAGEIVVNSIDQDGEMKGYDLDLVQRVRAAIAVPITVLGGAGSLAHIGELIRQYGVIGAAAGSLFVFKGVYRAVLISYPSPEEKDRLLAANTVSGLPG